MASILSTCRCVQRLFMSFCMQWTAFAGKEHHAGIGAWQWKGSVVGSGRLRGGITRML